VSGGGLREAAEAEQEDDVKRGEEREDGVVDGLHGVAGPGAENDYSEDDRGVEGDGMGEKQSDACSADGADEAGDASAEGGGPLGFEDQKGGHGQPVAVADVEVAIDSGAEQQGDGHADGVGGGVAGEADLVAEAAPKLAGAGLEAGEERWPGGFGFGGGVKDEVVEEGVDEHDESAAEQDHGGASDGEVQAELEVAGDDDVDAALLAHPTGGWAEAGEHAVVEGRDDDEEKDEPGVVRAERADERGGGDAEGEQSHAEQAGG